MRILSVILGLLVATQIYAANFTLHSSGFADKGKFPDLYTCEGGNVTPPLSWSNPPAKTQAFALVFSSLDTPVGILYNWILYNIPNNINGLAEGIRKLPEGTVLVRNSFQEAGYRGPCPPDAKIHRYIITVYALDTKLELDSDAEISDVLNEIKDHTLQQAQLSAVYNH